jgi:hypothetical protein
VLDTYSVHWGLIGLFVVLGIAGSFAGSLLSQRLNQRLLRKLFAVLLVGMGIYILYENLPSIFSYTLSLWILTGIIAFVVSGFLMMRGNQEKASIH